MHEGREMTEERWRKEDEGMEGRKEGDGRKVKEGGKAKACKKGMQGWKKEDTEEGR